MPSKEFLAELHRLNRAEKLRVVQLLVNELAAEGENSVELPVSAPPNFEDSLDAMAADPHIQREISLINAEFSETEMDGS